MSPKKLQERKGRMRRLLLVLRKLYPHPKMALDFSNDWELFVSVVLSAQCTDKRVNLVTKKLFKKYRHFDDYVNAERKAFEQDIRSTGYYRSKAKHILTSAKLLKEQYAGKLPETMEELLTFPGVARKTANILLSVACGITVGIPVDTHVRRFAYRFDLSSSLDPKKIEQDLMKLTPKKDWHSVTLRFIDYGRDYCPARKHDCLNHPLTKVWPQAADRWVKAK